MEPPKPDEDKRSRSDLWLQRAAWIAWLVPGGQMARYVAINTPPAHVPDGIAAENGRLAERANAHLLAILAPRIQGEDTSPEKTS